MTAVGRVLLRVLLSALGLLLFVGSRVSRRFRAQITRDVVIEVTSEDGVAHHYAFTGLTRSVRSGRGRAPAPADLAVTFDTAMLGFRTLIRTDAVGTVIGLMHQRRVTYTGNAVYVLWFWGLTRMVLPYGRERRDRTPLPGALLAPDPASKVADRITREPVASTLDAAWPEAHVAQRALPLVRGSSGEDVTMW
ncbi:hypothetical protein [Sporichthya sp.]|uniref:hypothetical protein n=1 Tax=Sporichthya sp. TaxID=65475 RepID=UPI001832E35E|nr:hypothetical protein [Sporichthya sp.]MBA3741865.1 hypothetical protein [Sporichthya sp.]